MIGPYADIHHNLRYWIPRILSALRRARGRVVYYDVGANEGILSLPYIDEVDSIVAFEPGPVADRFEASIRDEDRDKVRLHRVALSDRVGESTLNLYSDDTFSSLFRRPGSDLDTYSLTLEEARPVPLTTLDALRRKALVGRERQPGGGRSDTGTANGTAGGIATGQYAADATGAASFPPPDFIKIDIEGAELPALHGMADTVAEGRPAFLIEYSCINTANAGYDRKEIVELLREWGYRPRGLYRAEDRSLHDDLEPCAIWNIVALPGDAECGDTPQSEGSFG